MDVAAAAVDAGAELWSTQPLPSSYPTSRITPGAGRAVCMMNDSTIQRLSEDFESKFVDANVTWSDTQPSYPPMRRVPVTKGMVRASIPWQLPLSEQR